MSNWRFKGGVMYIPEEIRKELSQKMIDDLNESLKSKDISDGILEDVIKVLAQENKKLTDLIATNDFPKQTDICGDCKQRRKVILDQQDYINKLEKEVDFYYERSSM